jgi:hypothetical protein
MQTRQNIPPPDIKEQTMRLGANISASLMYGLSWILLSIAALMIVLAILASVGLVTLPISVRTDLIGAAVCAVLGLLSRFLARRFEGAIYPG